MDGPTRADSLHAVVSKSIELCWSAATETTKYQEVDPFNIRIIIIIMLLPLLLMLLPLVVAVKVTRLAEQPPPPPPFQCHPGWQQVNRSCYKVNNYSLKNDNCIMK